ncbi:MAG TPA: glycosyltransferase [Micromonosporaceae bacterium]|nr:glycosyltransferase [Micromonosporaceae bacterium]
MAVVDGRRRAPGTAAAADANGRAPYRVQYRQLNDPWYLSALFWVWAAFLPPYLVLRVIWTNWGIFLGPMALALELFTILLTVFCNITLRRVYVPVHRPTDVSRFVVDCLIPTHREDVALIEPSVIAAKRIRGLRRILVLGNFDREEVRDMCRRHGVAYHSRGTNLHAKAGNLNNGLRHTDADFVLLMDADHMARPEILERLMGYFDDPRIAYAQAPQLYYNTEALVFRPQHGSRTGWTEMQTFLLSHQLGKNGWEACMFIGSTGVLRRAALDEIDGFATGTATEDVHTSLRLHSHGWKSVYTPEPLGFGLEAGNLKEFHNQRHRWAAGSFNLLFISKDSPLRARGMTMFTRWNFLYGILAHFSGLVRLGFVLLPALTLLTLLNPVTIPYWYYGPFFFVWYAMTVTLAHVLNRRTSDFRYLDSYQYGCMFAQITGMKGLFTLSRYLWTPKFGVRRVGHWAKWALWGVAALMGAALARGVQLIVTDGLSSLVFWCMLFLLMQAGFLLAFLIYLERFERNPQRAVHADLHGEAKYRYVMEQYALRRIGPTSAVLDRPLKPTAAPRVPLPAQATALPAQATTLPAQATALPAQATALPHGDDARASR